MFLHYNTTFSEAHSNNTKTKVGWGFVPEGLPITLRCVGRIGKRSINNILCHPELPFSLAQRKRKQKESAMSREIYLPFRNLKLIFFNRKRIFGRVNKDVGWGFHPNKNNEIKKKRPTVILNLQLLLLPTKRRLTREGARRVIKNLVTVKNDQPSAHKKQMLG